VRNEQNFTKLIVM